MIRAAKSVIAGMSMGREWRLSSLSGSCSQYQLIMEILKKALYKFKIGIFVIPLYIKETVSF